MEICVLTLRSLICRRNPEGGKAGRRNLVWKETSVEGGQRLLTLRRGDDHSPTQHTHIHTHTYTHTHTHTHQCVSGILRKLEV